MYPVPRETRLLKGRLGILMLTAVEVSRLSSSGCSETPPTCPLRPYGSSCVDMNETLLLLTWVSWLMTRDAETVPHDNPGCPGTRMQLVYVHTGDMYVLRTAGGK